MISPDRLEKGLYWQRAWKLVEGCTKVSPGCDNCWSETETEMRCYHPNDKINTRAQQVMDPAGYFDGHIGCREDNIDLPLRTKKPTVWAIWNDLYHEDVPDDFRDRAYAVMALCPQHTFLVLTKRAKRMAWYFRNLTVQRVCEHYDGDMDETADLATNLRKYWPLQNVWHGVTAENQGQSDARIPYLLEVPGKRFISIEPMLGPVDLENIDPLPTVPHDDVLLSLDCLRGHMKGPDDISEEWEVHAVLLGGESGKDARPMHPDWVRSVRDQCATAGVPFFFKQWGEWLPDNQNQKIRGESGPSQAIRVGKKKAGRTLDGRTHDDLPWLTDCA